MQCERCEGLMREEQVVVSGGTVNTKGISAWHCPDCERIEYRATVTRRLILEEVAPHTVQHTSEGV